MLPTLYGKKSLQTTLSRMASGERLAQSFLFYGDAGLGRKTVAHWFSALLLCEHPENGQPCGHCKSCHNLQKDCHPDLILVPHSGKLGGFSVETVRQICSSVSIPPNNGSRKVYLFLDCDQMDDRAQNLLLKQLEEPPAYAFFLFTASAKDTLLSTIRSRILSFGLIPCQPSEVQEAATALGIPDADFQRFPGNIGQTLAYATDSNLQTAVARIEDSIQALQQHNEYAFLKAVATIGKDRPQARFFLQQLRLYVRDVLVLHNDPSAATCSCAPQLAKQAARQTAQRQGLLQFETIRKAEQALQANGTVPLLLAIQNSNKLLIGGNLAGHFRQNRNLLHKIVFYILSQYNWVFIVHIESGSVYVCLPANVRDRNFLRRIGFQKLKIGVFDQLFCHTHTSVIRHLCIASSVHKLFAFDFVGFPTVSYRIVENISFQAILFVDFSTLCCYNYNT